MALTEVGRLFADKSVDAWRELKFRERAWAGWAYGIELELLMKIVKRVVGQAAL